MASQKSLARAAQMWCLPSTSNIEMNTDLAAAFAEELDRKDEALQALYEQWIWMSGSPSFSPNGEAHKGFLESRKTVSKIMGFMEA